MPKSKRRKSARHTPRPRTAVPIPGGSTPTEGAPAGQMTAAAPPARASSPGAKTTGAKSTLGVGLGYVRTELKVIGVIAGVIIIAIVAIYFGLR